MKAVLAKYVNLSGLQRLLTEGKSLGRKEDGTVLIFLVNNRSRQSNYLKGLSVPSNMGEAMTKINIDELTEAELIDLNHRIVERLRFLSQMRAHERMLEFKIGDRVTFQSEGRPPVTGMLVRYNRKTVTVITDEGQHWNVSPSVLRKRESPENADFAKANLIPFKKK